VNRQAIEHSSFRSPRAVRDRIDAFLQTYNHHVPNSMAFASKRSIANLSE
jgi:hypothetical protein